MDREENRLYIEAIKLAAGSVQYKNISVKDTMELEFPKKFYSANTIKLNKTQVRSMLGRWPTSSRQGMKVQEVVEDIIRKVENREEGVWYYKCEMTEEMYELVISEQNMFFHDLRRCIFYTFAV